MTETKTAAQLTEELAANEARSEELTAQATAIIEKAEGLKETISRAVAAGQKTDAQRKELRDAHDDFDGMQGAIDILQSDREKLEVEIKAVTISESIAARGIALKEWGAASDKAMEMLCAFYENELAPVYAAVMDAAARINQSESAAKAAGARIYTSELEYPERHSVNGGRPIPLLTALKANAEGHSYSASWGVWSPVQRDNSPEWYEAVKSGQPGDSDGLRQMLTQQ